MAKQPEQELTLEEVFRVVRNLCVFMSGVGAGIKSPQILSQVDGVRELLNRYERQQRDPGLMPPGDRDPN